MFILNFYKILTFWSCFLLIFYVFFFLMFWDKRGIKENKNTYLASFLTDVDYETLTELTLGGQSDKTQTTDKQLKFQLNHKWVNCN